MTDDTKLKRGYAAFAALQGAAAILAGAFAAHWADDAAAHLFSTGAGWQTVAALATLYSVWRNAIAACALFSLGGLLFASSLYTLAAGAPSIVGIITPIGGASITAGWLCVFWHEWRAMPQKP